MKAQLTAPDGTIFKEFFATSGWQTGLTTGTEVWSGGVKKKWTTVNWTQDDTNLSFPKNPRVTETNIGDEVNNRRRVVIDYYPSTSFSLPSDVYEYAANGTTLLRRTHTDYHLHPVYTDRRIIGLVFAKLVYDGAGALQSKTVITTIGQHPGSRKEPARSNTTTQTTALVLWRVEAIWS